MFSALRIGIGKPGRECSLGGLELRSTLGDRFESAGQSGSPEAGDPAALFELASAYDFLGSEAQAGPPNRADPGHHSPRPLQGEIAASQVTLDDVATTELTTSNPRRPTRDI